MKAVLSASPVRRVFEGLLLASAAVIAAACSSGTPAPSSTVTITQTPPSSSAPAASTSAPAPQTSTPAAALAKCAVAGLHVGARYSQGAAGTLYYDIEFTNISGSTCYLRGYPGVSLVSAGSNAGSQVGADAKRNPVTPALTVTLAPGQTAHAVLGITEAGNFPVATCNPVTAHWLKVFPPDQFSAAYVKFTTQTCASTSQPTMRITVISAGA